GLLPQGIPDSIREVLVDCAPRPEPGEPSIDAGWGEPGLTTAEKLYAWNTFEVLAFRTGNPDNPVNAIPGRATATCQVRFVAGCDPETFVPLLRSHLDAAGYPMVKVAPARSSFMQATRMDPKDPWVQWAAESMARTTGTRPGFRPNMGGARPNDGLAGGVGRPAGGVPPSYAGCSQHAPAEHVLAPILREGLQLMTGLFWDLGERDATRP
ncbi:MAG: M20 peptidase family dipeptidase, partial [bacterium]